MRIQMVAMAALIMAAGVFAQDDADAQMKLLKKQLSLGSVVKSDFRDDKDQKFERVKLITEQDEDNPFIGTLRFTVELTDRAGETYWGQISKAQGKHPSEYEGKDEWTFEIPHGELDRPKMTAYALEYGWETNKVFTPVVQDFYKAESADEITDRNKDPKKKLKVTAKGKSFRKETGE